MKKILLLGLLFGSVLTTQAQFEITFKLKGAEDSTVNLIRYYGEKLYYADTAVADKQGVVKFDGKFANRPGMYAVMGPGQKFFEVILNKENVYIETDMANFMKNMSIKESDENTIFYEYINFISTKRARANNINERIKKAPNDEQKKTLKDQLKAIDKEVTDYQKEFVKKHDGTLAAKIVLMSIEVQIPDFPRDADGNVLDSLYQRKFYLEHYWDHFDLKDDAMTRIPAFHKRLENLFENVLLKQQDTLIKYAHKTIEKMSPESEIFKYTVVHVTNKYQQSKIMCLDAVFVDMVLKYYKTGKATWMTEDKNKEIVERAEAMAPIVCGEFPHNVGLQDTLGEWPRLYNTKAHHTILMFWSPDCGHCKKEIPKLVEKYNKWKEDGIDVEVFAVSSINGDEWQEFIRKHNMNWINVAVPQKIFDNQEYVNQIVREGKSDLQSLNYHDTFDIYKTPTIFLLREDKKIVGKNLESDGLDDLIRRMVRNGD